VAASNINVVVITGNLTQDPELRSTGGGTSVCEMRVAVNSRRKDGQTGEWVDKPNYFNVVVFGAQGENCAQYLSKGRPVAIEGRLDWREWEAKDGSGKRQAVQIVANSVQFLGSRDGGGGNYANGGGQPQQQQQQPQQPQPQPQPQQPYSPPQSDIPADMSDMDAIPSGGQEDDIPF
jgi:single-strand DNA-binding protein